MKSFIVSVVSSLTLFSAGAAAYSSMQCGANARGQSCPAAFCCSRYGWCGTSTAYCSIGCQSAFGSCTVNKQISNNGKCGGTTGKTCKGSGFGSCCSASGLCGYSDAFCGVGCNPLFGTCSSSSSSSSSKSSSTTRSATSSTRSSTSSHVSSTPVALLAIRTSSTKSSTSTSTSASSTTVSSSSVSSSASASTTSSSTPTPSVGTQILTSDPFLNAASFAFSQTGGSMSRTELTDGTAYSGSSYLRISAVGSGSGLLTLQNTTPLTGGSRYQVQLYYRALSSLGGCSVTVSIGGNQIITTDTSFNSLTWTLLSGYYTASSGDTAGLTMDIECPGTQLKRVRRVTPATGLDFNDLTITTAAGVVVVPPGQLYTPVYPTSSSASATPTP